MPSTIHLRKCTLHIFLDNSKYNRIPRILQIIGLSSFGANNQLIRNNRSWSFDNGSVSHLGHLLIYDFDIGTYRIYASKL
jgi:hypothetical protein